MEGLDSNKLKDKETDPTSNPSPMKKPRVEHSTPEKSPSPLGKVPSINLRAAITPSSGVEKGNGEGGSYVSLPSAGSPPPPASGSESGSDKWGKVTAGPSALTPPTITIADSGRGRGSAAKKASGIKRRRRSRSGTDLLILANPEEPAAGLSPAGTPTPARNVAVLEGAQAKPLSQFEEDLNQEPVIDSELQKSGTLYSQILPQEPVFARWSDKNYYSGVVQRKGLYDTWVIDFDDGMEKAASEGHIIPVRILGVGVNGTYCPDTHFEAKEAVILGQKFQIDPEGGGGGGTNVKYAIKCEGDDTQPIWCSRRQLTLKEPEAKRLRAGYASIAGGKPGDLSIGNILWEPRHRTRRQTSTEGKSQKTVVAVALDESSTSTPKDGGRGPGTSKATPPAAEAKQRRSRSSSTSEKAPETDKDSRTASPAPAKEMPGEETPAGTPKSTSSALEPPGKENSTKTLFQGCQFFITGRASFAGAPEIVGPPPVAELVPYIREDIRDLIADCGGEILDAVGNENERKENVFLISDSYARTFKYMYSLAAGIPCVSWVWIKECVAQLELVDWKAYALPAGWSLEHQDIVQPHVRKPLKGCKIFIPSETRPMDDYYEPLVRAAEAVLLKPSGKEGPKIPTGTELVVTEELDITQEIWDEADALLMPVVKAEWMLQSIITGEKRENYDHEKYAIPFDEAEEDDDEFVDGSVHAGRNNDHVNDVVENKQSPD